MQLSFLDWKCNKEVYADWNQQNYDQKKIVFCLQKFRTCPRKNKIHGQFNNGTYSKLKFEAAVYSCSYKNTVKT